MDGHESENQETTSSNPSHYPEPSRASYNPYPVIQNSSRPSLSDSAHGSLPLASADSYEGFPDSATDGITHDSQLSDDNGGRRSYGSWPRSRSGAATEAQTLSQLFRVRQGDPGSSQGSGSDHPYGLRPQSERVEERSALAGVWQDDIGGKAASRRAWLAAVRQSGDVYDNEFDQLPGASEAAQLLEDADIVYSPSAGKSGKRAGKGRGGWRQLLKGTEHEKVGKGEKTRGSNRGRPRSRRAPKKVDPGREFKSFLRVANQAFVEGDLEGAADNARQAILANPEIHQAYALLRQVLTRMGRTQDALQVAWDSGFVAASPEVWMSVADQFLEAFGEARDPMFLSRAAECYGEALKLHTPLRYDPELDFQLRARALDVYDELGDTKSGRTHCKAILKRYPSKTEFIRRLAVLCAETQDTQDLVFAKDCYEKAFEIYKDEEMFGDEDDSTGPWSHLNIYLELVDLVGEPAEGIVACKRLARWFLGRKDEQFWDQYVSDDREFDDDNQRRGLVGEFQQGRVNTDPAKHGQGLPIDIRVRLGLLRLKMGAPFHDEAMRHLSPLLQYEDSVEDYHDMFLQVAAALRQSGFLKEAADYYSPVRNIANADHPDDGLGHQVWMQMAICYQALGRIGDAISAFENVRLRKGDNYNKACARLAKLYENTGETDKARFLCTELIMLNRRDLLYEAQVKLVPYIEKAQPLVGPLPPPKSLKSIRPVGGLPGEVSDSDSESDPSMTASKKRKRPKKRGVPPTQHGDVVDPELSDDGDAEVKRPRLRKLRIKKPSARQVEKSRLMESAEANAHENYGIVKALWDGRNEGNDESVIEQWTEAANCMLDEFVAMRVFFPERDRGVKLKDTDDSGKHFIKNQNRTEGFGPQQFLKIPFSEWHHVFVDLGFVYVGTGEQDRCYRIMQEVLFGANVFYQDPRLNQASYGAALHCAFAFNDSQYLIQLARQMIADNQYRNGEPYQLLAAVNRFSYGSNWFSAGPSQKFMLRMVKQNDYMAMPEEVRSKVDWSLQGSSLAQRVKKYPAEEAPDAHVLLIYGHMVAVANHSHSAMPYYYRAFALQPDNICVNLSIAAMWIQNSMKRQTGNRQFGIAQGLSFMCRYYDLRVASGNAAHIQEAEYNVARMWHYLGLTHLAVPAYEKVLGLSEDVQAEWLDGSNSLMHDIEDYAPEAAFALQGIYAIAGNSEAARRVTEEWLVM